jgi:hypothetical protein
MTKPVDHQKSTDVDGVRHSVCAKLAKGMQLGAFGFQFRFIRRGGIPVEAWVYCHQDHEWRKRDDITFPADVAEELFDEFEMISKRDYADDWSCRRIDHSDRTDFELKFRREAMDSHMQNGLESFLMGCLFYGHHDSGEDSRRRIKFRSR